MFDDVPRSPTTINTVIRTRSTFSRYRYHNSTSNGNLIIDGMIQTAAPGEFTQHCSNVPFEEIYTMIDDLCRGRFSSVRKCSKKDANDHQIYAAKIVKKRHVQQAINELRIFQYAQKHPHFVTLFHVFDSPTEAIFILEFAKHGDLQLALEVEGCLDEPHAAHVVKQVLDAVAFLHDHKVVHLDIKPQNILLMEKWPSTHVKLCDFGLSRVLTNECLYEISGTTDFLAPEVVNYEPLTCATDMWSIGVLIYVLITGHTPFGGTNHLDTQNNITHCILDFPRELFEKKTKKSLDLMKKLIVRMPKQRLTAHECLKHSWICFNEETSLTNSLDDDDEDDDESEDSDHSTSISTETEETTNDDNNQ